MNALKPKKEELSKILAWFKLNLNYIILIPTIIGGLWQMIELYIISPSFIRFFSVTQMIPDGLVILSVICGLMIIQIPKYIINRIEKDKTYEAEKEDDEKPKSNEQEIIYVSVNRKKAISNWVIYLFMGIVMIVFFFSKQHSKNQSFQTALFEMLVFSFLIDPFYQSAYLYASGKFVKVVKYSYLLYVSILFMLFINVLKSVHSNFTLPKNLINGSELIKSYKSNKVELRYWNDKYIFLEVKSLSKDTTEKHFEVLKFDKLFENQIDSIKAEKSFPKIKY